MKKYTEKEVRLIGSTIKGLRNAVRLIDNGIECITYPNTFQYALLETDKGNTHARIVEVSQDIKQLIKKLKRIYFSSDYDDYELEW